MCTDVYPREERSPWPSHNPTMVQPSRKSLLQVQHLLHYGIYKRCLQLHVRVHKLNCEESLYSYTLSRTYPAKQQHHTQMRASKEEVLGPVHVQTSTTALCLSVFIRSSSVAVDQADIHTIYEHLYNEVLQSSILYREQALPSL